MECIWLLELGGQNVRIKVALNLFARMIIVIYCNAAYPRTFQAPCWVVSAQKPWSETLHFLKKVWYIIWNCEYSCKGLNSYLWDPCLYIFIINQGTLKILFIQSLGKTTQRLMCLFMMAINRYNYHSKLPLFRNPFFSPNKPQNRLLWFQFGIGST